MVLLYSVRNSHFQLVLFIIFQEHSYMLARYETLLLTIPEITADEAKSLESQVERIIKDAKGAVVSFEKWGKYRLSYPIRKNDYGVYFLARFEGPGSVVEEIRNLLAVKLHELIMRQMTVQLDPKASLTYQRPPSLEDTPTRDVNTFLKENKMEGLISDSGNGNGDGDFDESDE